MLSMIKTFNFCQNMQNNLALYLASKPFLFIYSCNYSFFFLKLACDLTLYLQCTQPCLFPRFHCSQSVKKNVLFRRMKATGRSSVCCSRLWTDAEFSCWAGLWDWWEHLDPRASRLTKHLLLLRHSGWCGGYRREDEVIKRKKLQVDRKQIETEMK